MCCLNLGVSRACPFLQGFGRRGRGLKREGTEGGSRSSVHSCPTFILGVRRWAKLCNPQAERTTLLVQFVHFGRVLCMCDWAVSHMLAHTARHGYLVEQLCMYGHASCSGHHPSQKLRSKMWRYFSPREICCPRRVLSAPSGAKRHRHRLLFFGTKKKSNNLYSDAVCDVRFKLQSQKLNSPWTTMFTTDLKNPRISMTKKSEIHDATQSRFAELLWYMARC